MSSSLWDTRALALFRLGLGFYLTCYSALCLYWGGTFFTEDGILPLSALTGLDDHKGWGSIYLASRWWAWSYALLLLQLILSVCLTIGFRVSRTTAPLAYLLWSLSARNPFVSGLAEDWLVLLVLVAALLPTTQQWSVEEAQVWWAKFHWLKAPREIAALILFLTVPAAWICELLFTEPSSPWTWFGLLALTGVLLPKHHPLIRNAAVIGFLVWMAATWHFQCLTMVGLLVCVAFLTPGSGPTPYSVFFVPALAALLLQSQWLVYRAGLVDTPFPETVRRQTSPANKFQEFQFSLHPDGREPESLYGELKSDSFFMRRYLNSLYRKPDPELLIPLMSYHARTHENQAVGDTTVYTIILKTGSAAERLFQVQTVPTSETIWKNMPALDRNPLQ